MKAKKSAINWRKVWPEFYNWLDHDAVMQWPPPTWDDYEARIRRLVEENANVKE